MARKSGPKVKEAEEKEKELDELLDDLASCTKKLDDKTSELRKKRNGQSIRQKKNAKQRVN